MVKLSPDIISIIVLLRAVCDLARFYVKAVIKFSFLLLPLSVPHHQILSSRGLWQSCLYISKMLQCFSSLRAIAAVAKRLITNCACLDQNLDCKHILTPNIICNSNQTKCIKKKSHGSWCTECLIYCLFCLQLVF